MAVFPTILVDSTSGSDTAASGAGPATALTGAAASDGSNGKTVTITDAVDLSGVATDGSAAIYISDATAGHRNFDQITSISGGPSGSPWTVTVANGFSLSLSGKSWAIGGKRASIGSSTSVRLLENNSANGDAMPGWSIKLAASHAETISSTINCRRPGDATSGRIRLTGDSGSLLTFSANSMALKVDGSSWTFSGFSIANSNVSKTASAAFAINAGSYVTIKGVQITSFWFGVQIIGSSVAATVIEDCFISQCTNGIGMSSSIGVVDPIRIENNAILSCTSHGITDGGSGTALFHSTIVGNVIAYNGGNGINIAATTLTSSNIAISGNVIHGNASNGIVFVSSSSQLGALSGLLRIENNDITLNGGYGVNFSGSGITDAVLDSLSAAIRNNRFFSNSSGTYFPSLTIQIGDLNSDPSGGLATASKDYTGVLGGTNFMSAVDKGKGYPIGGTLAVGTLSSSYQYRDIGLQHQDSGGSGGLFTNSFSGGML